MIALLLLFLLPLPDPWVARAELHPAAEACYERLIDPPAAAGVFLGWDEAIDLACRPLLAPSGCDAALHGGCALDRRQVFHAVVETLLGWAPDEPDLVWLSGGDLPRGFDLYTAAAAGVISTPEMHARLIAGLLVGHVFPSPPDFGGLR